MVIDKKPGPLASCYLTIHSLVFLTVRMMAMMGIASLICAICVVVGDVIWRRIGAGSFIGVVDITRLCLVAATSWSIPYAFSRQRHVGIDFLANLFSPSLRSLLDAMSSLLGMGVMMGLFYLSQERAMEALRYQDVTQDLGIPMVYLWAFFLIGLIMSALVCLMNFLALFMAIPVDQEKSQDE